jgi:hypothetical protein
MRSTAAIGADGALLNCKVVISRFATPLERQYNLARVARVEFRPNLSHRLMCNTKLVAHWFLV